MDTPVRIFLSYAPEDTESVGDLYQKLSAAGFKPWMDEKDVLPGEKRKLSIQRAIHGSDFFLVCLSRNSVGVRGHIRKGIREALDICDGMLDSDIYLIPVRLEDCELPESLRNFEPVNLFEEDGWERLQNAIQVGMQRRAKSIRPATQAPRAIDPQPSHESSPQAAETGRPADAPQRAEEQPVRDSASETAETATSESPERMRNEEVEMQAQVDLEELYRRGEERAAQGDWSGAISSLMQVNRTDADYKEVSAKLKEARRQQMLEIVYDEAWSHRRKRQWGRAREKLEEVLAQQPGYRDADRLLKEAKIKEQLAERYREAQEHIRRENWQQAVKCLEEVVRLDSGYENASAELDTAREELRLGVLYRDGMQHFDRRAWQSAKDSFEKIAKMRPEGYRDVPAKLEAVKKQLRLAAEFERAQECEEAEEWPEAIRVYIGILTEDADKPEVAERLANAQKEKELLEKYRQAESYLADERWVAVIELLSWIVEQRRDYKDAEQKLRQARDQQEAETSYTEGLAHFDREEWGQAAEKLQRVVRLDPHNEDAGEKLKEARRCQRIENLRREGIRYLMRGEFQEAINRFNQVLEVVPEDQATKDLLKEAKAQQREDEEKRRRTAERLAEDLVRDAEPSREEITSGSVELSKEEKGKKDHWWWIRYVVVPVVVALIGVITIQLDHCLGPAVPEATHTPTLTISPSPSPTAVPTGITSPSPSPTATPTPTATSKPTPTVTPVRQPIVPTPTAPTSAYPPPMLEFGGIIGCDVTLRWVWPGELGEDEWFAVRVWREGIDAHRSVVWRKERVYVYTLSDAGEYSWDVAICRGSPSDERCSEPLTVSERGVFSFGGCSTPAPTSGPSPSKTPKDSGIG